MGRRILTAENEEEIALELGRAIIGAMRVASQNSGGADIEICQMDGTAFHVLVRRVSKGATRLENCWLPDSVWGEPEPEEKRATVQKKKTKVKS